MLNAIPMLKDVYKFSDAAKLSILDPNYNKNGFAHFVCEGVTG